MAIKDYIRPMLEVYQQLEVTQFEVGDKMAACIVGADYDLYRYGYETITPTPFNLVDGSMTVPLVYERIPSLNYKLDTETIKLFGENMLAQTGKALAVLAGAEASVECQVDSSDVFVVRTMQAEGLSQLLFATADAKDLTASKAAFRNALNSSAAYAVQAGDTIIYAELGKQDKRIAKVVDLVGKVIPASVGTPIVNSKQAKQVVTSINNTYKLEEDTTFVVTIVQEIPGGDYVYTVTDTSGICTAQYDETTSGKIQTQLGNSTVVLTATLPANMEVGDYITVTCKAASVSTTEFDGLRLDNVAADLTKTGATAIDIWGVYKEHTGEIVGGTRTVEFGDDETADPDLKLEGSIALVIDNVAYPYVSGYGNIYPSFRVMIQPQDTEDKYTITSIEDIQKYFGTVSVENDLAYACYCALEGSAGRQLYALRVADNTPAAYTAALNKVETDVTTYNFCILTQDRAIIKATTDYVTKRSEPDFKRWCRVLVGVDTPGEYVVAATDKSGATLTANIGLITNSKTEATHVLQLTSGMNLDFLALEVNGGKTQLMPGDQIANGYSGARWTVVEVKNATTVTLAGGPATSTKDLPIRVYKADTPVNAGEYVATLAEGLNMRRCSLVWCDKAVKEIDGKFTVMPNKYLAATVAGIGSAVVPQAPITHTEITTIDSAVRMYTKYTQKDLDNIAKDGVLIITQDAKALPCYIRHQLTTETDKGVMYYEESCTRNLDNISYAVVDILEKYIGRANVTPSALRAIKGDMISVLNSFMDDSPSDLIGPSLLRWDNLSIKQDSVFKDRVIVKVDLYLPLPLNNIKLYEMAYIADVTID